jgi:hypothetical protein
MFLAELLKVVGVAGFFQTKIFTSGHTKLPSIVP